MSDYYGTSISDIIRRMDDMSKVILENDLKIKRLQQQVAVLSDIVKSIILLKEKS